MATIDIDRLRPVSDDIRDIARAFTRLSTYIDGLIKQVDAAQAAFQKGLFQESPEPQPAQFTQNEEPEPEDTPRRHTAQLGRDKHRWTEGEEKYITDVIEWRPQIGFETLARHLNEVGQGKGSPVSAKAVSHRLQAIGGNAKRRLYDTDGNFLRFTA